MPVTNDSAPGRPTGQRSLQHMTAMAESSLIVFSLSAEAQGTERRRFYQAPNRTFFMQRTDNSLTAVPRTGREALEELLECGKLLCGNEDPVTGLRPLRINRAYANLPKAQAA